MSDQPYTPPRVWTWDRANGGRFASINPADMRQTVAEAPLSGRNDVDDAVAHNEASAGRHFDPALIAPFKAALPQMLDIRQRYAEENGALPDLDFHGPG